MKNSAIVLAIAFISSALVIVMSPSNAVSVEKAEVPALHQSIEGKEIIHVGMGENQPL